MTEVQAAVSWPVLQEGVKGSRVKTLQYLLRKARDLWRKELAPDGIFGPKTEAIVKAFQGTAGLTVDGIVGQETWSSLTGNVAFESMASFGDDGEHVKGMQNELNRHKEDLDVDGIFGNLTDAAVRRYQKAAGLPVDGIVGPNTWRELITR